MFPILDFFFVHSHRSRGKSVIIIFSCWTCAHTKKTTESEWRAIIKVEFKWFFDFSIYFSISNKKLLALLAALWLDTINYNMNIFFFFSLSVFFFFAISCYLHFSWGCESVCADCWRLRAQVNVSDAMRWWKIKWVWIMHVKVSLKNNCELARCARVWVGKRAFLKSERRFDQMTRIGLRSPRKKREKKISTASSPRHDTSELIIVVDRSSPIAQRRRKKKRKQVTIFRRLSVFTSLSFLCCCDVVG